MKSFYKYLLNFTIIFFCTSIHSQENHIGSCATEVPENFYEIENNNKESFDYYLNEYYNKKQSKFSGKLMGIKGQYLIFDEDKVLNYRAHEGHLFSITIDP